MTRELAQVLVIPRRLDAAEDTGDRRGVIPTDAESFAVGRLGPEPCRASGRDVLPVAEKRSRCRTGMSKIVLAERDRVARGRRH